MKFARRWWNWTSRNSREALGRLSGFGGVIATVCIRSRGHAEPETEERSDNCRLSPMAHRRPDALFFAGCACRLVLVHVHRNGRAVALEYVLARLPHTSCEAIRYLAAPCRSARIHPTHACPGNPI